VSGTIELTIDDTTFLMTPGDSFFFKAYLTNSYRNVGRDRTASPGDRDATAVVRC
jgi:hypothetical protein